MKLLLDQVLPRSTTELLAMKRLEFVRYASRLGIPFFDMSQDEFEAELRETKALQ